MKKLFLAGAVTFLTGCPGPMDPLVPEHAAQATVRNNEVCILVPADHGESIFSIELAYESGQKIYKIFDNPATRPPVVKGRCLPTFGYQFAQENTYTVYYKLEKNDLEQGRLFSAHFSVTKDSNGRINISQFQR